MTETLDDSSTDLSRNIPNSKLASTDLPYTSNLSQNSSIREDSLRQSYRDLIDQSAYQPRPWYINDWTLPELASRLRSQTLSQRERGRVAVFDYKNTQSCTPQEFERSEQLRQYLDDQPVSSSKGRLFVLEDLPRNYVEILGSRLRILPSVFAAHMKDPEESPHGIARVPLARDIHQHFILHWAQAHAIKIDGDDDGATYAIDCNAKRTVFSFPLQDPKQPDWCWSHHLVSYWVSESPEGSWNALLMVDSPLSESVFSNTGDVLSVRPMDHPKNAFPTLMAFPSLESSNQLHSNPEKWHSTSKIPSQNSMYENIVSKCSVESEWNPTKASSLARKLVLWRWLASIDQHRQEADRLCFSSVTSSVLKSSLRDDSWNNRSTWRFSWDPSAHRQYMEMLEYSKELEKYFWLNAKALGIDSLNPVAEEWEAQEWKHILRTIKVCRETFVRWREAHIDGIAAREAQDSNYQARSVGQLTAMATIFVPVSIVAGILSMGGEFAAGNDKFWVFFVVVCPVVIILALALSSKFFKLPTTLL